jgi:hypothetical protein
MPRVSPRSVFGSNLNTASTHYKEQDLCWSFPTPFNTTVSQVFLSTPEQFLSINSLPQLLLSKYHIQPGMAPIQGTTSSASTTSKFSKSAPWLEHGDRLSVTSSQLVDEYKTWLYICCQCNDGPKVGNIQAACVNCGHIPCSDCQIK